MFVFIITAAVLICSNMAFKLEQSCSKFEYEEKTLEKLIRLQIFVERMKDEVDATHSKVRNELHALTKERERFQTEIREMKDALETTKADIQDDLVKTKNQHLEAIKQFADEVTKIKESSMVPPVAFKSNKVTDTITADGKVIIFTTDQLNYENSYSYQTGVFTVPKDGVYMFWAQLSLQAPHTAYYAIYVNDEWVQRGLIAEKDYYTTHTMVTVADVVKGDRITVRCVNNCVGDNLYEYTYTTSSFSGILIHGK